MTILITAGTQAVLAFRENNQPRAWRAFFKLVISDLGIVVQAQKSPDGGAFLCGGDDCKDAGDRAIHGAIAEGGIDSPLRGSPFGRPSVVPNHLRDLVEQEFSSKAPSPKQ